MKPIFIILYPNSMSVYELFDNSIMMGFQEIAGLLRKECHVLLFGNSVNEWDFKLLKGTEEEYSQLSEITEKILMQEVL